MRKETARKNNTMPIRDPIWYHRFRVIPLFPPHLSHFCFPLTPAFPLPELSLVIKKYISFPSLFPPFPYEEITPSLMMYAYVTLLFRFLCVIPLFLYPATRPGPLLCVSLLLCGLNYFISMRHRS